MSYLAFMYSNTTLYYLNQMGIRPWVRRTSSPTPSGTECFSVKLLVLTAETLSHKAQTLLQQILLYLNLQESEFAIAPYSDQNNYQTHLILSFGTLNHERTAEMTCIESLDLDYLMKHPLEKKKVYAVLSDLKLLLNK